MSRYSLLTTIGKRLLAGLLLYCSAVIAAEQTWTVNFKDTDLRELIRFVAQATDKTIIVDPKVTGRVEVISSQELDRQQLYELFLSILEVEGFTAIEANNVVRIVPAKDARSLPVPVPLETGVGSEFITQVIQLENVSAAKLLPVLRPLVPQQAHMAAYAPSNAIIVSDTAANIDRIRSVIKRIDLSAVETTEVIQLEYAAAEEIVKMLDQLQKSEAAKGQAEVSKLTLAADKRTNSVLVNGDELQRQRIRSLISHLDTPLVDTGNVRVVYLKYARAAQLAEVLTRVLQNVEKVNAPTGSGTDATRNEAASIEADEDTNSLIITANAEDMQSILTVVTNLDIRRAQVLVEAIIVELRDEDTRQLGLQWLFLTDEGVYGSSSSAATNDVLVGGLGAEGGTVERGALATALSATQGQILGIGQLDDALSFNVVLNALNANSDANILSTPTLLTMDNQEASIMVGQNVPFETGSYVTDASGAGNPFTTIERANVGITLKVTPQINEGDALVLEIVQEVSNVTNAAATFGASDIITNERKIETRVLVDDGEVIVLGGLIQDDVQNAATKVPLLGDIPWLGRLFRYDDKTVIKQHLMVFLRATIMRDNHAIAGATADKYQYIRDRQLERIDRGDNYLFSDEELPLLPEWEQQLKELAREHPKPPLPSTSAVAPSEASEIALELGAPVPTTVLAEAPPARSRPIIESSNWQLQVGSFRQPRNAQQLAQNLQANNYPAYTRTIRQRGQSLTVVYVGPITEQTQALQAKQTIDAQFNTNAQVQRSRD